MRTVSFRVFPSLLHPSPSLLKHLGLHLWKFAFQFLGFLLPSLGALLWHQAHQGLLQRITAVWQATCRKVKSLAQRSGFFISDLYLQTSLNLQNKSVIIVTPKKPHEKRLKQTDNMNQHAKANCSSLHPYSLVLIKPLIAKSSFSTLEKLPSLRREHCMVAARCL